MSDNSPTFAGAAGTSSFGGISLPAAPAPSGPGAGVPTLLPGLAALPPAVRRVLLPASLLTGTVLAGALLWSLLGGAQMEPVLPSAAEADRPAIAAALDAAGIAYSLDAGSGAVEVAREEVHRARMALAAEGLPREAPGASALLDSIPMGSSRAVEGERLRLSREADLARSIESVDGVEQARVHLAVEQRSPFVRERSAPAASVMLRLRGQRSLSEAQSAAIVHLVAASVPGLAPERVSIVDQAGRLLSGEGRGANSPADQQLRIQAQTEERLRQAVVALLTPIVGADNFSAQVNAQLTFDERQATRETYPENEQRLMREEGARETGETGGAPTGIPGALSSRVPPVPAVTPVPPDGAAAATGQAGAGTPPSSESFNRQFQWGREVSVTRAASGTVRRLTVAVALANPPRGTRTAAEIAAIEALVRGAVGFDEARGDVVTVSARRFAPASATEDEPLAGWLDHPWVSTGMKAGLVLLLLLLAWLLLVRPFTRAMREKQAAAITADNAVEQAAAPQPAALPDPLRALQPGGAAPALDSIVASPDWIERAGRLRSFAEQNPDAATQVIQGLLREPQEDSRG